MRWSFLLLTLLSCRTPAPPASTHPTSPAPTIENKASIATQRLEIPRAGHKPVVIELPVVKGIPTADRVNAHLTAEKILGEPIEDVSKDARAAKPDDVPFGVQGSHYRVPYHAHELLEIEAFTEYNGAYPSTMRFHALIDLRTGDAIGASSFLADRIPGLVQRLEAKRVAEAKAAVAKEPLVAPLVADRHVEEQDLNDLSPRNEGLVFNFDYQFPHAALAFEPPGRFAFSWADVSADIDPSSALARAKP